MIDVRCETKSSSEYARRMYAMSLRLQMEATLEILWAIERIGKAKTRQEKSMANNTRKSASEPQPIGEAELRQ